MIKKYFTQEDRETLLRLSRQVLETVVNGERPIPLNLAEYSEALRDYGASFVTLTINKQLRGCIGALEAHQPLVEDVVEHTMAAATQDYRFPPVKPEELAEIKIEISRLTKPQLLTYNSSNEIISQLRPGIDGVVLRDGVRRATFLPQVWEKIKEPVDFLNHLCMKMGMPTDTWRTKKIDVSIYQVEEFHE